ncbi:MAG: response regulator transcription factor [Anaerolineales bacterium]|jgi:DNA-binding NarL/FixJ family response regulator
MIRILLADDKPEILSSLRLLLETRLDLELITEARDMEHVLAQVEDSLPNAIIMDWDLPGRPTRERISVLRALVPEIKIIVVNTRPELRNQVISEGADAFICKTDPPQTLLEAIQKLCLPKAQI